jgi:sugar phosphate isomerase/epimerase
MKLSLIPLNFGREIRRDRTMSNEDWIRMAVELGLDGTEIYEPFLSDLNASGIARLADFVHNAGLEASMYTPESDFSNPETREQAVAHCKRAVDAALVFGAGIVRITAASHGLVDFKWMFGDLSREEIMRSLPTGKWIGRISKEDVMQSCADGIKACLDYAEEKQVMLAFEDHWGVGTNLKDFMRILELVDDDRLKVNLDTANVGSKDIVELTGIVKDRVVHTHCSELLDNKHGVVIGKGEVDFKGIFTILKNNGYAGWISLEALAGGKEDLRFSVEHIRNTWNSL